jgi:hypothetical protein
MKQLILTFFAVILLYSLFIDNEPEKPAVDEINYIYEDAASFPENKTIASDTLNKIALYNMETVDWSFYTLEYGKISFLGK